MLLPAAAEEEGEEEDEKEEREEVEEEREPAEGAVACCKKAWRPPSGRSATWMLPPGPCAVLQAM